MKIGIVLPALPAYSETFFKTKISGLIANGHTVILFVPTSKSVKNYYGAKVQIGFPTKGSVIKLSLFALWVLFRLFVFHTSTILKYLKIEQTQEASFLITIKKSIIHNALLRTKLDWLHFGFGTMALEREHIAEAIGAKMAVSFRGFDYYVYPIKNSGCYTKLWSKTVRYHVLSESMKLGLISYGIPDSTIFIIPPAIDTAFFSPHPAIQSNKALQILTTGRLHWIKGLDYTLEALGLLYQKGIAFHYTIIGTGPEEERLRFTAHQLGINPFVTFAGKQSPE